MDILQFKKANCKNCFKCLRDCSVKAIAFRDGQAEILNEDCLLCGHCLTVCPQNAKEARNDTEQVREMIRSGHQVIASVAPSFIAGFPAADFQSFALALRRLGFHDAQETSVAARMVTDEYQRLLEEGKSSTMISSCCPTIIRLIEKYYPQLLPFLAPVLSPMTAHARMLKEQFGSDCKVVFIGPCLCKKEEATWESGAVDCAMTFEELQGWFDEKGIAFTHGSSAAAGEKSAAARLFPIRGGVIRSMSRRLPGVRYVSADGLGRCREVLDELTKESLSGYFIEMNACEGGCINGPCMTRIHTGSLTAQKSVEDFAVGQSSPAACPPPVSFSLQRRFTAQYHPKALPGEKALRDILAKTGKLKPEQELNCGACGYPTCREKAIAVYQGKAEVTMCMPYMRERAEYISNEILSYTPTAIVALDSRLNIQALNSAACRMFRVTDSKTFSGRYISELVESEVFEEAVMQQENILNRKVFLYRYGLTVEETVVYVREHNFVFGLFRDMTDVEKQNDKLKKVRLDTVQTADKVIEKQMCVVQEIAMLLGETTAETKVALTKLKEAMLSEEE